MSKGQVRFMQHMARNSARVSVSGLGVDREREIKRVGGPGKKRGSQQSAKAPTRGPAAYGIRKLHVQALQELDRYLATGRLAHPTTITFAALKFCSEWFDKVSGADRMRSLVPGLIHKERTDCQKAFKIWLKSAAEHSAKPTRSLGLLAHGRINVSGVTVPGATPDLLYRLAVAAWWIRGAIIRAAAETKGEGWMAIPPKPASKTGLAWVNASTLDAVIAAVEAGDDDGAVHHVLQSPAEVQEAVDVRLQAKSSIAAIAGAGTAEHLVRVEYARLKTERANAEHARVAEALIQYLKAHRWRAQAEVDWIDVLGTRGGLVGIFEVKSLTDDNEIAQVRAGVSQLMEYRWRSGRPSASLWLALSKRPIQNWIEDYLKSIGIGLLWFEPDGGASGPDRSALETAAAESS